MLSVTNDGVVTIMDNFWRPVDITVYTHCDSFQPVTHIDSITPNLTPDAWDVDIDEVGGTTGLQFDPKIYGDEFTVSIKINAQLGSLITYSLSIYFESLDLEVTLLFQVIKENANNTECKEPDRVLNFFMNVCEKCKTVSLTDTKRFAKI